MRRTTSVSALVLAGALALPAVSYAQTSPSADDQTMVTDTDRTDDRSNWGWLGLFGLAGLLGLKRNDRENVRDRVTTRQTV